MFGIAKNLSLSNRGVVVHQPRPAARCWSVREVASARGLRGRLSTASLLCPERRSALHPHHPRATIYVSPDHDLTKARGDAPSQGQITFLVVKAWRYERTKVVKVALSPDPIKSVKAPEATKRTCLVLLKISLSRGSHLQQKIIRETAESNLFSLRLKSRNVGTARGSAPGTPTRGIQNAPAGGPSQLTAHIPGEVDC